MKAPKDSAGRAGRIVFTVRLDRRGVEALHLELRRLASRRGLTLEAVRFRKIGGPR